MVEFGGGNMNFGFFLAAILCCNKVSGTVLAAPVMKHSEDLSNFFHPLSSNVLCLVMDQEVELCVHAQISFNLESSSPWALLDWFLVHQLYKCANILWSSPFLSRKMGTPRQMEMPPQQQTELPRRSRPMANPRLTAR